jgi:hypothetical protein
MAENILHNLFENQKRIFISAVFRPSSCALSITPSIARTKYLQFVPNPALCPFALKETFTIHQELQETT